MRRGENGHYVTPILTAKSAYEAEGTTTKPLIFRNELKPLAFGQCGGQLTRMGIRVFKRPKQAQKSTVDRSQTTPRPRNNRARITNGTSLLPTVDGRCLWARRYRDLLSLHLSDLGGESACSEAEKALTRRAACLIVELERLEDLFATGEATPQQLELYQTHQHAEACLGEPQPRPATTKPGRDAAELGSILGQQASCG